MNTLISLLLVIMPALAVVAFLTLFERNVIATLQSRFGPNLVLMSGGGQAVADALKLMMKELILPYVSEQWNWSFEYSDLLQLSYPCIANSSLFWLAPFLTLLWSLLMWIILPFGEQQIICDLDLSLIFNYAMTSLGSYGILLSGWASNSKYAWFGAVSSVSQMISYEVSIGET